MTGMPAVQTLWAIRYGNGDIISMPDKASAELTVGICDSLDGRYIAEGREHRHDASVVYWPGTAAEHANALEALEREA